ncbi:MAG: aminopeptidase, partial [Muribaculaceae bacterium]|nr:aminopeptidase [Muribaculaceae bacterium]
MNKTISTALAIALSASAAMAEEEAKTDSIEGFTFTDEIVIPVTSVKDQNKSGTCWCFSGTSFFENEIRKAGG